MHTQLHPLPHCLTTSCLKAASFSTLLPHQKGCGKPVQEEGNKKPKYKNIKNNNNKKPWLISQEQQCQTWLASSTSKYILPTLMPHCSALRSSSHLLSESSVQLCNCTPAAHPSSTRQESIHLPCFALGSWYCHTKHLQAKSSATIS